MIQATQLSLPWRAAPSTDGRDKSITNASWMEGQKSSRGLKTKHFRGVYYKIIVDLGVDLSNYKRKIILKN
jgi:hypothetical protein